MTSTVTIKLSFSVSSALPGIYVNILPYNLSLICNQCSRDRNNKKSPTLVKLSKCAWCGTQAENGWERLTQST